MKRFLKVVLIILIFGILIILPTFKKNTLASYNNEMKIYSINIGEGNKGD